MALRAIAVGHGSQINWSILHSKMHPWLHFAAQNVTIVRRTHDATNNTSFGRLWESHHIFKIFYCIRCKILVFYKFLLDKYYIDVIFSKKDKISVLLKFCFICFLTKNLVFIHFVKQNISQNLGIHFLR